MSASGKPKVLKTMKVPRSFEAKMGGYMTSYDFMSNGDIVYHVQLINCNSQTDHLKVTHHLSHVSKDWSIEWNRGITQHISYNEYAKGYVVTSCEPSIDETWKQYVPSGVIYDILRLEDMKPAGEAMGKDEFDFG